MRWAGKALTPPPTQHHTGRREHPTPNFSEESRVFTGPITLQLLRLPLRDGPPKYLALKAHTTYIHESHRTTAMRAAALRWAREHAPGLPPRAQCRMSRQEQPVCPGDLTVYFISGCPVVWLLIACTEGLTVILPAAQGGQLAISSLLRSSPTLAVKPGHQ